MLLFTLVTAIYGLTTAKFANVSSDERAITINGKRTLLLVGAIHYPRSTPEMWPDLFKKTKEAGLNAVDTYVFWNEHEEIRGQYDFTGNRDLRQFIQEAHKAGLYVVLRIGPYVCAEWNFGGVPTWVKEIPGMVIRDYNEPWMKEMARFTKDIVELVRDLTFPNGGPIILMQIENEYKYQQKYYENGQKYIDWSIDFALSTNTNIPWFVCQQENNPKVINTCNWFYCDDWIENRAYKDQPAMWTENWVGWFQKWGEAVPKRPTEDIAFAVARFFAKGGVYMSYYMFHGGANYGRSVGGPGIITSYDYDAPLDEYGQLNEPKYSHLKAMHAILNDNAETILSNRPIKESLGDKLESHSYGKLSFISNYGKSDATVKFQGKSVTLPRWSVSLVNDGNVLYNTAQVKVPFNKQIFNPVSAQMKLEYLPEPKGAWSKVIDSPKPLEQISLTHDKTDYLWYIADLPDTISDSDKIEVDFSDVEDYVQVYIDDLLVAQGTGSESLSLSGKNPTLGKGKVRHQIKIKVQTLGLVNFGHHPERYTRGILGNVKVNGKELSANWTHQVGLLNEIDCFKANTGAKFVTIGNATAVDNAWYRISFSRIPSFSLQSSYAIDMSSMKKGQLYVNGHHVGRYWNILSRPQKAIFSPSNNREDLSAHFTSHFSRDPNTCDYAGTYSDDHCRTNIGGFSQQYYQVPSAWLNSNGENSVVIYEELGGDLSKIQFNQVVRK